MNERDHEGSARAENATDLEPAKRVALMVAHWRIGIAQLRTT